MNSKKGFQKALLMVGILILLPISESSNASTLAPEWWDGNWSCTIDGRPAKMRWYIASDDQTICDDPICTSTSGVKWAGKFSDNGSKWVPLNNARKSKKGGMYFNHADGNRWYLAKPEGKTTKGHTVWNGNKYPLKCWR